jgi:hypothetical protein
VQRSDRSSRLVLAVCAGFAACSHQGRGTVVTSPSGAAPPVALRWQSGFDAGTGQLSATAADGRVYRGPFAQIRADLGTQLTGTTFLGWSTPGWAQDPWYGGPPAQITGANSPKVVALLTDDAGDVMRCRLELRSPDRGMAGGADGDCLLPDGRTHVGVTMARD